MMLLMHLSSGLTMNAVPHAPRASTGPQAVRVGAARCDADRCYYGAVGEDGAILGSVQKVATGPAPKPSPTLSPADVADAQFTALSRGSFAGIEEAHAFVSPQVIEEHEMDIPKFRRILESDAFEGLIGCSSWTVLSISQPSDDVAAVELRVLPKPIPGCVRTSGVAGQAGITWPTYYKFIFHKQAAAPFANCWMLDNMAPTAPPIDVEAADGTPQLSESSGSVVPARGSNVRMAADAAWSPPATVGEAKTRLYGSMGEYNTLSMAEAAFAGEMIQSTQFALLAPNFEYSPVYAIGFEELCREFLSASTRAADIRVGLCKAFDWDPATIASDAEALLALADGKSEAELLESDDMKAIAAVKPNLKYTYTFGAGLIILMQKVGVDPDVAIPKWCEALNLNCVNAFTRDYAYYKLSKEKMVQLKEMLAQMKEASEKQAKVREAERAAAAE